MVDRTLHTVALAAGLHRVDHVVIGRLRFEVIKTYSENRRWMIRIQPDWRFGGLDQAIRIGTVVHDSVMHRGSAGIIGCPADNRQILLGQLNLGSLDDFAPAELLEWSDLPEPRGCRSKPRSPIRQTLCSCSPHLQTDDRPLHFGHSAVRYGMELVALSLKRIERLKEVARTQVICVLWRLCLL